MKTMRLSEAIRLGSMMKPQAFGSAYGNGKQSCALAAAADAIGMTYTDTWTVPPREWRFQAGFICPECGSANNNLTHLNDTHRWPREKIADYVETLEREAEQVDAGLSEPEAANVR